MNRASGWAGQKDQNGELGELTHYDYGFRIYNPGIGKFLSVDPLTKSYPMLTPYQFASNSPIGAIDLDGLEHQVVKDILDKIDPALGNHVIIHVGPQVYPEGAVPSPIITHVQQVHKQVLAPSNRGGLSDSPQIYIPFQEPDLSYQDQFTPLWQKWFSNKADINLSNSNLTLATIFGPTIIDKFWKAGKFTLAFLRHSDVIKGAIKGANKFTRKLPTSGFKSKGVIEEYESSFTKIKNIIDKNLDAEKLQGAIKDIHGFPSGRHEGHAADHIGKVVEGISGLKRHMEIMKKFLKTSIHGKQIWGEAEIGAKSAINAAEKAIKHAQKVIDLANESKTLYK